MTEKCIDVMGMHEALQDAQSVVIDYSFSDPMDNLCYDDTLLALAESGQYQAALRFWESTAPFVVLGRSGDPAYDLHVASIQQDKVKVFRRSSGGGTVVQGPGCLNYAVVLPKVKDWQDVRTSYCDISTWILSILHELGVDGVYKPISDLAVGDRKFSGNAQRRSRNYILQHGTLLYDFDLDCISRWLALPKDQPPYRANRPHSAFITNISFDPNVLKTRLASAFQGKIQTEPLDGSLDVLAKQRELGRVQQVDIG